MSQKDGYKIYSKKDEKAYSLYILYPGAKVEADAYASLAEQIALENIDVAIVNMPFNLAFFGMNKAQSIIKNTEYKKYYLGGHSLGGAMACSYAFSNPDNIDGMILLASYASKVMPDKLSCLSLIGTNDQIVKKEKFEKNQDYFSTYKEVVIDAGNHGGFGHYGHQKGEGDLENDLFIQWETAAQYIANYIFG